MKGVGGGNEGVGAPGEGMGRDKGCGKELFRCKWCLGFDRLKAI